MSLKTLASAVAALSILGVSGSAQRGRPLFSADTKSRVGVQERSGPLAHGDAIRQRHAEINWDNFLVADGDRATVARTLELNLFDDVFLVAVLDRAEELSGTLIWTGRLTASGQSRVTFVLRDGVLRGLVEASAGTFELCQTATGSYVINQLHVDSAAERARPPVPGFVAPPLTRRQLSGSDVPAPVPPVPWLTAVNTRRAEAGLPAVTENAVYSAGDLLHAKYIVKTNTLVHAEDPASPWYTKDGDTAGQKSNVAASSNIASTDQFAVDGWMQAPFHAVGVLDPKLKTVGFGSYREAAVGFQMGAALDVIRGLATTAPTTTKFPITWPGNGKTIAAPNPEICPVGTACFWGENPSPLTSCTGYLAPAGLPVILQIGAGTVTPKVTSHSFTSGGVALEHCIFDETTYKNPEPNSQSLGRSILKSRNAIVLIPRTPLPVGQTYTAKIVVNGATRTWSFTIQPLTPLPMPTP